jgi:hypothetical protein
MRRPAMKKNLEHNHLISFRDWNTLYPMWPSKSFREELSRFEMWPVDVSYAAPQAHGIVNVALHREYSPGIIFIFSQGRRDLYQV